VTFRLAHNGFTASEARPSLSHRRRGPVGELDLARRERFLLAVGVHIACATIAIVDRPTLNRGGRPN
jgi:hypothetical protein